MDQRDMGRKMKGIQDIHENRIIPLYLTHGEQYLIKGLITYAGGN